MGHGGREPQPDQAGKPRRSEEGGLHTQHSYMYMHM